MATNDCIVHSRQNISNFHATVNQLRRENKFPHNVYQELPKRCCSCNGKTGLNDIDFDMLMNICDELALEQSRKPKSFFHLTLSFEPETDVEERRTRLGRFIGKKGGNLNVLQDKYNILLHIKQDFPIRRVRRRNLDRQETDNANELQVFVRRNDKLITAAILVDEIKEEINEQWHEASEIRFIQKQFTFDQNQFQFVSLSFESTLSSGERHDIMGRFIGKKGEHLRHLEDQYHIHLHIIDEQSSNRKYFQKLIEVQEDHPDSFYLFITKKDKSKTNEIAIEEVKQQIIQKWKEATIEPTDDGLFHILSFSYESKKSSRRHRRKIGCFIGKNGQHLRDLQAKYDINIQIINNSSGKKLQKKLAKIQDKDKLNKLYLLIENKNKSSTNTIPIDQIHQDLCELWTDENQTTNVNKNQPWILKSEPIDFSSDLARLADATPPEQKQILGENLFPLIQQMQPDLAGKITGMLLEIDNTEILRLLESHELLKAKVEEAIAVLQAHQSKQTSQPTGSSSDLARLDDVTPPEQKQMLGERLFPLIQQMQPELAGKITGMILEIDNTEILRLLQSRESLKAKVEEAIAVLLAHQAKQMYAEKQTATNSITRQTDEKNS